MGITIGSLTHFKQFSKTVNNLKEQIAHNSNPLEPQAKSYEELGKDHQISAFIDTKSSLNKIEDFIKTDNSIENKIRAIDSSLVSLEKTAIKMRSGLVSYKGPDLKRLAESSLFHVKADLNQQYEGRYLFSGFKTNTPPVGDLSKSSIVGTTITTNYYQGDNNVNSEIIADNFPSIYGIKASDDPFKALIGGINLVLQYTEDKLESTKIKAEEALESAINGIIDIRANLGNNLADVNKVTAKNNNLKLYFTKKKNEAINHDPIEMVTNLQFDKAALIAAYQSFSLTSKLSISQYL